MFTISCNNKSDDIQTPIKPPETLRFFGEYTDYYVSKFQFEYKHNSKLIDIDTLLTVFKRDSSNMIKLVSKNSDLMCIEEFNNLIVKQKKVLNTKLIRYDFYKIFNVQYQNYFKKALHIEFPKDKNAREKIMILSIQTLKPNNRAMLFDNGAYIKWINMPAYSEDYFCYMWGINKSTDTITTNLSLESIKMLYPDFEGKYIFKKYDSIVVDYSFIDNFELFFKKIKFFE